MKILVAEDNLVFRKMLRAMLVKWGYEVIMAEDSQQAWDCLQATDGPRLAILDWMMPGMDGVEVCRRVRAAAREPYVYILLLTAKTETQDLVEGMEAGADDYLSKPFVAHELRVRLRAGRRILDLQEELVQAREDLRRQATRDGLTGLWNRTAVLEILYKELARARRERSSIALLMIDLDHFKEINDTYGHLAGDEALRGVTRRLSSSLRCYDSIGRYGGEEFLVVLPGCNAQTAVSQADRLRQLLAGQPFQLSLGVNVALTCSIGVCAPDTQDVWEVDALVHEADTALYAAKALGRNRVQAAAPGSIPNHLVPAK